MEVYLVMLALSEFLPIEWIANTRQDKGRGLTKLFSSSFSITSAPLALLEPTRHR